MRSWLHRWSGFDRVLRVLGENPEWRGPEFVTRINSEFRIDAHYTGLELPPLRSAVFVCTHHTGAADFLASYPGLARAVPDLKIVMNRLLLKLPPLARIGIGVHGISHGKDNREGREEIEAHLARGGNILVFPAGKVGLLERGQVTDQPWRAGVARMIQQSAAWVVPVHVDARNTRGFYFIRRLFPRLSMLFMLRALGAQAGKRIQVGVGKPIAADELSGLAPDELLARLRRETYELADAPRGQNRRNEYVAVTA